MNYVGLVKMVVNKIIIIIVVKMHNISNLGTALQSQWPAEYSTWQAANRFNLGH